MKEVKEAKQVLYCTCRTGGSQFSSFNQCTFDKLRMELNRKPTTKVGKAYAFLHNNQSNISFEKSLFGKMRNFFMIKSLRTDNTIDLQVL